MSKGKLFIGLAWLALIAGTLYFHSKLVGSGETVRSLTTGSIVGAYSFYFLLGCVRGFTFMPLTILLGFGMLFLQPIPLFVLSVASMLVSSLSIYHFASVFEFYDRLMHTHKEKVESLESGLREFELPLIIGWSFCPVLPTDLVCCVSGIMKLSVTKLMLGIFIGEGICCALYIFFGRELIQFFS